MFLRVIISVMLVSLAVITVRAQTSFPNQINAVATTQKIMVDGVLNEAIWNEAVKINNFTQRELNFNQPASELTQVAIAYNTTSMFIAVWCFDSMPQNIISKELKRDFNYLLDDNFIVIIDTYNDKRNGFMFVTNPNAARADLQVFNNGASTNAFWNGVWYVKTTRTQQGWFAEFEIPFSTLKYRTNEPHQLWGVNFERNIRHKREQVLWQGWSRNNKIQQVNQAGELLGLNALANKQFVEVKPYGIAGANKHNSLYNAGGDINYLLSPSYRLNLTFNTDFAQVESDQQQVNITRFPLFFPELREFFLEGEDFFNMGFGGNRIFPFYTRKIGLDSNRNAVPIIAGARLLGKEQNHTIGLMSLQTDGTANQAATNYTTASWRQDVGKQSMIGAMTTNKIEQGRWHSTTGVNGRFSTSTFLGNKNLDIGGALINSYNTDSGFNANAFAFRSFVSYLNDRWSVFASAQKSQKAFDPEVGLQLRKNFTETFAEIAFRPRPQKHFKWIRQFEFIPASFTNAQYNDTRSIQSFEYVVQYFGLETRKGERFTLDYRIVAEGLTQPFAIAQNVVIPKNEYWWRQMQAELTTFRGRTVSLTTALLWGDFYNGQAILSNSEALWRAGKHMNIAFRYEQNNVQLPYGNFTTNLLATRVEYAVNPNMFGSLLGQWNSSQELLNINFRLHIIPKVGTDFFLIVNQLYETNNKLILDEFTVLGKLIWRFTL